MSMRDSSPKLTPCELIREINDLCQGDTKKEERIRELCGAAEKMTKRIAQELHKYSKEIWKDEQWWKPNIAWKQKGKRRVKDDYKYNNGKKFFK